MPQARVPRRSGRDVRQLIPSISRRLRCAPGPTQYSMTYRFSSAECFAGPARPFGLNEQDRSAGTSEYNLSNAKKVIFAQIDFGHRSDRLTRPSKAAHLSARQQHSKFRSILSVR